MRKIAGTDHVGIGADFYRAGTTDGSPDSAMSRFPYLFAELLRRGYSDGDVLKIASRNHLRAMRRMEQVAAELRRTESLLISERAKSMQLHTPS